MTKCQVLAYYGPLQMFVERRHVEQICAYQYVSLARKGPGMSEAGER